METVASWHGEVNYKRYQSLGVVGWLVGLGSTDSQLPLRADPRARAIPSSLALLPTLPLSLSLTVSTLILHSLFFSLSLSFFLATISSDSFYLIRSTLLPSLLRRSFVLTSHQ